jgi:uncharacterized metal-binding protein YceD (DUF177 family)
MSNPLFDRVLPEGLASIGQRIEYKGKISEFVRLVEIVEAELAMVSKDLWPRGWRAALVDIRLEFAWGGGRQKVPTITGRVSAQIPAVCQRCLEVFELLLDAAVEMRLLRPGLESDDFAELAGYDVWEIEADALRPYDIVEESLVMAIPLAPRHESRADCGVLAGDIADVGSKSARPFAGLRSQLELSNKE